MSKNSGIYQIRNTISNKLYIGSSVDIVNRWRQHKLLLRKKSHDNFHLQNAWNKYGEDIFEFEVVEIVEPINLSDKEQQYINKLNPEYNIARVVKASMFGRKHTEESKARMSESRTGIKNGFWGRKHSDETKKKISEWRVGKEFGHRSDETKKKMSDLQIGNKNSFYGKHHSDDSKEKISKFSTGRIFSLESRKKVAEKIRGENHYNTRLSDDSVRKIRSLWKAGEYSQVEIGNIFGVNNKIINSIVNFRTWKWLE